MGHLGRFDIDLRVRGSYNSKFGQMYLRLKQEYDVDGSTLIKRIFEDADKLILFRAEAKATALRKKEEGEKELRRLITGEL